MNRRDTIIIAVLLNAALLTILFVMAVNTDEDYASGKQTGASTVVDITDRTASSNEIIIAANQTSLQPGDEIDNALKQFSDNPQLILVDDEPSEPTEKEPPVPPVKTTTPPQNPEAPKSSTAPTSFVEVTVKKGDALEKIARANGTTVDAIKDANLLKTNKLNIGQVLKVPVGTKTVAVNETKPAPKKVNLIAESGEQEFYVIKSGDNPWKIAKQYNVRFDDLLKLNNLDEEKARNLKVGDRIRVK
jgi:LysM repeat protein